MAYYNIEPFGEERADYRAGIISSVLANIYRKKGARPFKPEDFMLFRDRAQDDLKLSEKLKTAFKRFPGTGPKWQASDK